MEDPPLIAVCSPSWSPSHLKGQIDNRFTDPVHRSERDLVPKAPVLSTKSPLCSQISARVLRTLHDPYKYSEEAVTCVSMVSLQELVMIVSHVRSFLHINLTFSMWADMKLKIVCARP